MQQIWGTLARAVNDDTLIDEAIGTAITSHGDDPNAHLEAGQSLTTHRAADIIDHLAESVVNDKLASVARAYVAIVGSGLAGDYTTIEDAVAYATTAGGGTILVTPGTHYLAGATSLPVSINIVGFDAESTIIHGSFTNTDYLKIIDDTVASQKSQYFENLTFYNDGGGVFHSTINDLTYKTKTRFINCVFNGGGQYVYTETTHFYFDDCTMSISDAEAVAGFEYVQFDNSIITRYDATATMYLLTMLIGDYEYPEFHAINCNFNGTGATTFELVHSGDWLSIWLDKCTVTNLAPAGTAHGWTQVISSYITGKDDTDLTFGNESMDMFILGSLLWPYGTGKVVLTQAVVGFTTCQVVGSMDGISLSTGTTGEMNCYDFEAIMNSYTSLSMASRQVTQQTPTANRTVTTTVPRAGMRRTLILLTSGTNSYTYTFNTGFKTTGTLATGTTTARRFVLEFISDGTYLIETSRTVAIA